MSFDRTITEDDLDAASAELVRELREDLPEHEAEFEADDLDGTLGCRILTTFTG